MDRGIAHPVVLVASLLVWILVAAVLLSVIGAFSLELFYVLSFLGFLALTELLTPSDVSVGWRRAVGVLTALGLVGFIYLIYRRLLEVLPPGIV